jgi:hypothetical protein
MRERKWKSSPDYDLQLQPFSNYPPTFLITALAISIMKFPSPMSAASVMLHVDNQREKHGDDGMHLIIASQRLALLWLVEIARCVSIKLHLLPSIHPSLACSWSTVVGHRPENCLFCARLLFYARSEAMTNATHILFSRKVSRTRHGEQKKNSAPISSLCDCHFLAGCLPLTAAFMSSKVRTK